MPVLSQALANKRFLTKLLLDNNKIGPVGAATLAKGLSANETLTNLHLANCSLGEEGTLEIAQVL
jgi:Ran GTPase-activating protein (RanGAP) involved in mRNA processing and transport